ncbi:MAG: peptidoglycan-associated lipoprotein [Cyclobacteriaceae bacterium]|jgi:peptidoglycan-associated lipoprotein
MKQMQRFLIVWVMIVFSACSSVYNVMDKGDYDVIISKYASTINKNEPEINYQVAEAYRKSNRIQESEAFYEHAVEEGVIEQDAFYYYAKALKANQKYDKALDVLEDALPRLTSQTVKALVENEIVNLSSVEELKSAETYFRAKNLDEINTNFAEYSPVFINNYLYFTSNRSGGRIYKATGTPFLDIYRVQSKGANIDARTLEQLPPSINDPEINEGSIAISADGMSIIFAKGNNGKATGNEEVNLYFTRYRNGQWLEPRPIAINDPRSWDSTPALSPDGTTLYFSSTRPGGIGGMDLYSAKLNRRGRWVDVRNLGPEINTPGNEMFPFISEDGNLYFSSDAHPGLGKIDIFRAVRRGGLVQIQNLGRPMNSEADDFSYYEFNLTRGFFSSNRKGGKGDDDIYTFVNDDPDLKVVNYFLTGNTVSSDESGAEIALSNSKVLLVAEDETVIDESFADQNGNFRFRVYPEEKYFLIAEKTEYFTTRKIFSTIGRSIQKDTLTEFITNVDFETKIHLDRIVLEKPVVLNNIYYDLDKSDIRADAAIVLDSLVMIMEDNPDIYVELGSHTDDRAGNDYNMDLSWNRARSAVGYIIQSGVDPVRIVAKGYGESRLLIKAAVMEEDHQVNRRTEFKVLRYNPKSRQDDLAPEQELDEYDRFFDNSEGGR